MKGSTSRAYRLATAVAIGGVFALGATGPVLADNSLSYYNGSGAGSALNLSVSPNAVLNANLSGIQSILSSLPAGAGQSINNVVGSTLANPTGDILVTVDSATANGESKGNNGAGLTSGGAVSTPVVVNAAALQSELNLLNAMVQNLPAGTVSAVQSALQPLISSDTTGTLQGALDQIQAQLGTPIADTLGNPTVHLSHSVSANFGEDKTGDIATINQGGLLTQAAAFHLDPFEAKALPSGAAANNAVTSLNIAPSLLGKLSVPAAAPSLISALGTVQSALQSVENKLGGSVGNVPVAGGVVVGALGTVTSTVNNTTDAVVKTGTKTVDLTKVDQLVQQIANMRNSMAALNGLQMNDIIGTGPSTALGSIVREGNVVKANGFSQAVRIDAVKLNNPVLAKELNTVLALIPANVLDTVKSTTGSSLDLTGSSLVTVEGIKASANVALDGVNQQVAAAEGHLASVSVLGIKVLDTDTALAPGTSCTVSLPGKTTCAGSLAALNNIPSVPSLAGIGSLITVTLTRGAAVIPSTNSITSAAAKIVTLEVKVDLNLAAINAIVNSTGLSQTLGGLPLSLGGAANGTANLADVQLGVASAEASLNPAVTCQVACQPRQIPPSTGNSVLPLAILALALVAAGAGLSVRQARLGRN
ncbi:MAG TPA: hypothetical protein VG245_07835 [Candidatus Dormibacteraeota bacterium]|nr:hypothetical protein [Candidatus Dormibacteraeota bacterium]